MSLHYLNPDDEPRECPDCPTVDCGWHDTDTRCEKCHCHTCLSTGRLGVEGAEPEIEVQKHEGGFDWRWVGPLRGPRRPMTEGERALWQWHGLSEPTKAAALEAARKAPIGEGEGR